MTTEEILEELDPLKHDFKERLEELIDKKIQMALDNHESSVSVEDVYGLEDHISESINGLEIEADNINGLRGAVEEIVRNRISFSVEVN